MKRLSWIGLSLVVVLGFIAVAQAADEGKGMTLNGTIACAKCTLKQADAKECQSVLVVDGDKGAEATQYYIVSNKVSESYMHVCGAKKPATVTGTVAVKDGKTWITPTKIEEKKS